ncbi:MoaD/ThiS family protein [Chloroflexota bacterium]
MSINFEIPYSLQSLTNNTAIVEVEGSTIGECLEQLATRFPKIRKLLFDKDGNLDMFGDIYVNGESFYPQGLARPIKDGDELYIAVLVGGG